MEVRESLPNLVSKVVLVCSDPVEEPLRRAACREIDREMEMEIEGDGECMSMRIDIRYQLYSIIYYDML